MDQEIIRIARRTDLAKYLVTHHPDAVKVTGQCVYLREHDSIYTKFGFCGYTRFSSDETGNSIDFLQRYLGYSFQDAVTALTNGRIAVPEKKSSYSAKNNEFAIPAPDQKPYKRVFAYLTQKRGIPGLAVQYLIREGLLFQEAVTGNAVFINKDKDLCELRGTCSYTSQPYHGIRRRRPDCYWAFANTTESVKTAYICESSIDAISLFVLHRAAGIREPAAYASIGGVRNQQAIDRIRESVKYSVLAVDNDSAGQECRNRNANMEHILSTFKDWNEDLLRGIVFSSAELHSESNAFQP